MKSFNRLEKRKNRRLGSNLGQLKIGEMGAITTQSPLDIKSKNKDEFSLNEKKEDSKWNMKSKVLENQKTKEMEKPNPRLRDKQDLINKYFSEEKISPYQLEQFSKHIHHHTKKHIKKMLVEIHRHKKSFKEAHTIAKAQDEEQAKKLESKKEFKKPNAYKSI
tara:strand:+ start:847 stop:1335 length:489 start_codon:yes stop_codon:yes gene_type:complete